MTENKNDQAAQTLAVRKGHTMGDFALTIYDDLKSGGVQAIAEKGKAVLVSAGGALVLLHKEVANFINEHLAQKAESIPPENRQPPDPTTMAKVVPALNAVFGEENLRKMFFNLLAATMDRTQAGSVLPAFAEVIKQLSSDEALILNHIAHENVVNFALIDVHGKLANGNRCAYINNFGHLHKDAGCAIKYNACVYMDNLYRLGLIDIMSDKAVTNKADYVRLENDKFLNAAKEAAKKHQGEVFYIRKMGGPTHFGHKFIQAVILTD